MLFANEENERAWPHQTSKKRRKLSGQKVAGSKVRRCGKKKSGRGKKKSANPKPLSNVIMKPSISRLVKARTSAKMAASTLDKGTGGHATEDTIGKMPAYSVTLTVQVTWEFLGHT